MPGARCARFAVLGVFAASMVGCLEKPPEVKFDTVPASGTVKLDGKPLANAGLMFIPATGGKTAGAYGMTDENGKYELTTGAGQKSYKGAVAGDYKVCVSVMVGTDGKPLPPDPEKPPAMRAGRESLPPKYSEPMSTTLKVTIGPSGGDKYDIDVTSK